MTRSTVWPTFGTCDVCGQTAPLAPVSTFGPPADACAECERVITAAIVAAFVAEYIALIGA